MLRELPDNFQLDQCRAAMAFDSVKGLAIDAGAHRGIWTREIALKYKKVIAIEPTDRAYDIKKYAEDSMLDIVVHKAACGRKIGKCSMQDGKRNTGQTHVTEGNDVPMITIDSLNVAPSFIKIDVEGMEFDVLKGAKRTILEHKPIVLIEENSLCLRYGHVPDRASNLLERWGAKKLADFYMFPEKDRNVLWGW